METATNSKSRTLIIGTVAGIIVAGAIGAAFMLGGQTGSPDDTLSAQAQASPTTQSQQPGPDGAASGSNGTQEVVGLAPQNNNSQPQGDGGQPQETVVSQTPVPEEEEEESPTETPTATPTSTPWGPDDIAPQPTSTPNPDPCPFCVDAELAGPIDTQPIISNITTSFCFPNLVVKFDLAFADVVWFTYVEGGVTHHSTHIDADTFLGFLSEDVGFLGWGVYFISDLRIHATDADDDHVWSAQIPVPEPDLAC